MKLSVIIPVYQAEATLQRCLDSICRQGYADVEVILVDDGSTDRSPHLCDAFAAAHEGTKVIHQANGGAAAARNAALDVATGDCITFADSDDTIADNTFAELMKIAKEHPEYDLIEYPIEEVRTKDGRHRQTTFTERTYHGFADYWLNAQAYRHTFVWNKVFRSHLFQGVRFQPVEPFEDFVIMKQVAAKCRCIATTPVGKHYYFRDNRQSLTFLADASDYSTLLREGIDVLHELSDQPYYASLLDIQLIVHGMSQQPPILPTMPYYGTWKLLLMHLLGMDRFCRFMTQLRRAAGRI